MATKDKLINLEDLKVLSDHVEGEVTDLKSDLSEIIDAPENIIDYNLSNFKQFTNYTGTYTATSDGFTFSKGESANYQIGLFFPVIVGHTYKLSYHVSSGASAQSYVMRNADYPNKLSTYVPEYAYNDNYASESGHDYTVTFTAVTNPECVLAFRISYSAPTDFTLTNLICVDTTENVKVYSEVLPFATNAKRGAVVVGNGLSISGEGVLTIDSSTTQKINKIETDVDLIKTVAVQKFYSVNVLDVSSESFGRSTSGQNWDDSLSIAYNENNGFRATISEYLNLRWWYLLETQSGKTYDVSCETSGMNSGCTLKIMKNYNAPAYPYEYSEDYVVTTLTDDGNGKYTGSFTANSDQYMFVIYKRYDSRDLTVTNVKCTDQDDVERYEMKIADSGSVGGIRIGSGLSVTENGIMSVDKTANIPTKYDGREFCVFNKCLCIGDSLTQGVFNHNEGGSNQTVVISKYSYPSILAKMSGVETTNLGNGGYTSEEWYSLHENDDLSGHDVCIISLGTNDATKALSSGTTQSWIQSIITKVKSQNKGIKIFVSNLLPAMKYNTQAYTDVNNYIAAVVQANTDCYLLDMTQYSACKRETSYAQEHLTAIGYRQEAEEFMNYIGYIMQWNKSDFRNVQFAGTDYDWDD